METAIEIIGGRWKVLILQELFGGTRRFSELHRALIGVSHRTLTQQLRELEGHGIVNRKIHRQVPPKVEYSLTPLGETLRPVIGVMHDWAESYSRATVKEALKAAGHVTGSPIGNRPVRTKSGHGNHPGRQLSSGLPAGRIRPQSPRRDYRR